jgi:hypothetical protein
MDCPIVAPVIRRLLFASAVAFAATAAADYEVDDPRHDYWKRPLTDTFSKLKAELEAGRVQLDTTGEKECLQSLLKVLNIPASSQMLIFSTTSLQLRLISPRNPRALYFNEDVYVGFIPGGKLEIVSLDPQAGGVFYIFPMPRQGEAVQIDRSTRCMNCHSREDTGYVPGLVVKSVVPGPTGGSLQSFRQGTSGHGIPYADRFGGWYLTGKHGITEHWGNLIGRLSEGKLSKQPIEPGRYFSFDRYLVGTSDVLPQLVHEHQVGFANRVIEVAYFTRENLGPNGGTPSAQQVQSLDAKARALVRYILFADEPPLPSGGVEGDAAFKRDFLANRKAIPAGASLKDFDLKTRLFRFRCSYMIYSNVFQGLPDVMKQRVYRRLAQALDVQRPDPEYAYLPAAEKQAIRVILRGTLAGLPQGW